MTAVQVIADTPWGRRIAALLILAAATAMLWLTQRGGYGWDWTEAGRHSLSAPTRALLERLDGPVSVTAFVADDRELRRAIRATVERFRRHKSDLTLEFVDPAARPELARRLDIPAGGELLLRYRGREGRVRVVDEAHLSAALAALAGGTRPWVVFTEGRGERSPFGEANHDLQRFAAALGERGMQIQALDPDAVGTVPDNTAVLVVASPQQPFADRGRAAIRAFLARGGSLLWLRDPGPEPTASFLAGELALEWLPGVVLSARNTRLGIDNPAFVLGAVDPKSPMAALQGGVLLPVAAALDFTPQGGWRAQALLGSGADSWNETDLRSGAQVRFGDSPGERRGPLILGASFESDGGARAVVIGDGDFVSNAYLDNGANRDLGTAVVHWLAHQDLLAGVARPRPADVVLELDEARLALLTWVFPVALPLALWTVGLVVRRRRRRR